MREFGLIQIGNRRRNPYARTSEFGPEYGFKLKDG
jgi:hypothetical protein